MTSLYKPIKLIVEFYYMSNSPTFEIFNIENRFRIGGEIGKNHTIPRLIMTLGIVNNRPIVRYALGMIILGG